MNEEQKQKVMMEWFSSCLLHNQKNALHMGAAFRAMGEDGWKLSWFE